VITLLAVEARRYLARRLTRVLVGVAVLGAAVAGVVVFVNAEKHTPELAAERRAARTKECVASFTRGLEGGGPRIVGPEGARRPSPAEVEQLCRRATGQGDADESLHLTELWLGRGATRSGR
jgi:hypothetical protein